MTVHHGCFLAQFYELSKHQFVMAQNRGPIIEGQTDNELVKKHLSKQWAADLQ